MAILVHKWQTNDGALLADEASARAYDMRLYVFHLNKRLQDIKINEFGALDVEAVLCTVQEAITHLTNEHAATVLALPPTTSVVKVEGSE